MITVAIADVHFLVREGLRSMVKGEAGIHWDSEAANRAQLKELLRTGQPDVLIFDFDPSGALSIEDLSLVQALSPKTRILLISADHNVSRITHALSYGVCSYLFKECDGKEVMDAIHATAKGERFFCQSVLDIIMQKYGTAAPTMEDCRPTVLSQREAEIVDCICQGLTAEEIAEKFFLSVHTVKTHRKNIYRKLGVRSTAELVCMTMGSTVV